MQFHDLLVVCICNKFENDLTFTNGDMSPFSPTEFGRILGGPGT